jgi:hypothetical protein
MKPIQTACYALIGSAFVLGALLMVNVQDRFTPSAEASLVISKERFTIMTAKTRNDEESLFVIENASQRLLVYKTDVAKKELKLASPAIRLDEEFAKWSGQPLSKPSTGRVGR